MSTRTNSINLATVRNFTGNVPKSGMFSVQLLSTNLSANTTFSFQVSLNGTNWDIAQEAGTDITDTLIVNETKVKSFAIEPSVSKWRILFDGETTGTISFIVNSL